MQFSIEHIIFGVLAAAALVTSGMTITRRAPVPAAMWMVAHFATLGALYLTLQAQFIAVIQVLVYAGAIMVLVLFVIMLLNMRVLEPATKKSPFKAAFAGGAIAVLGLEICAIIWRGTVSSPQTISPQALAVGTVENMGKVLFTQYSFPFEAVSFVLLTAVIGSVLLAKKKLD